MDKTISPCGVDCTSCGEYGKTCAGCRDIKGKVFWLEYIGQPVCPLYACPIEKHGLRSCAECPELPCASFYELRDPSVSEEDHRREIATRVKRLRP